MYKSTTTNTDEENTVEKENILKKENTVNNKVNKTSFFDMFCWILFIIFIFGLGFSIPIAEIVMAEKYNNQMICKNNVISPYNWLIVDGLISSMVYLSFVIMHAFAGSAIEDTCLYVSSVFISIFGGFFIMSWIIVGSVMFWRDCVHLKPKEINNFFWTILLMKIISFAIGCLLGPSK
jgi:hypothetical protein